MAIPKNSNHRQNAALTRLDHLALAFTAKQDVLSVDMVGTIEGDATLEEDFMAPAATTLPAGLATADTSAAGAPTLDYISDEINGAYTLTLAATDEAEILTLYQGDNLWIDPTKHSLLLVAFKFNGAGTPPALLSADQRFVVGLASARNDTLDTVASHAWFRVEGGAMDLLWETDDQSTDDNDNDTAVDIVDDTFIRAAIRIHPTAAGAANVARFYVSGAQVGEGDLSNLSSSDVLQFIAEQQKDGGTETDALVIDYVKLIQARS